MMNWNDYQERQFADLWQKWEDLDNEPLSAIQLTQLAQLLTRRTALQVNAILDRARGKIQTEENTARIRFRKELEPTGSEE